MISRAQAWVSTVRMTCTRSEDPEIPRHQNLSLGLTGGIQRNVGNNTFGTRLAAWIAENRDDERPAVWLAFPLTRDPNSYLAIKVDWDR